MFYTIAILVGGLMLLQSIFLSEMGKNIGVINSTVVHFICSLVFLSILMVFKIIKFNPDIVSRIPIYAYTGAVLGVFVVIFIGEIIPKMSVVKSTILIFSGQITAGLVIDLMVKTQLSIFNLIGIAFIGVGLILNVISTNTDQSQIESCKEN